MEKLLSRLKKEFIKVNILQASLDAITFFIAANLAFFLLDIQLISRFQNFQVFAVLSFVLFSGDLFYRFREYRLEIYEEKNPELREVLRTARDNLDRQNIAAQALFDEVMERARKVTSESIIPNETIIKKILVIGLLSFLTVISGIADFQLQQDGGELLPGKQLKELISGGEKDRDEFRMKNASRIFGDPREINSQELDISFNITGNAENAEEIDTRSTSRQELVLDVSPEGLNEDLELAKKYSLAIKGLEG